MSWPEAFATVGLCGMACFAFWCIMKMEAKSDEENAKVLAEIMKRPDMKFTVKYGNAKDQSSER